MIKDKYCIWQIIEKGNEMKINKQYYSYSILFIGVLQGVLNIKQAVCFKDIPQCNMKIHRLLPEENTEQYVLELPSGCVINDGEILTAEGYLLKDFWILPTDRFKITHPSFDINTELLYQFYDERLVVIAQFAHDNWYHWFLQILSRLTVLVASGLEYDHIYVNCAGNKWQLESLNIMLDYFNIDRNKMLITSSSSIIIQASTLLVPSLPVVCVPNFIGPDHPLYKKPECPAWLVKKYQEIFLNNSTSLDNLITINDNENFGEKIYISRERALWRRVSNEKELIATLEQYGFRSVLLEDIPVLQQAEIFHKARVIVGPHGAGFANTIFCKPVYILVDIENKVISGGPQRTFFKDLSNFTQGLYTPFYVREGTWGEMDRDMYVDIPTFIDFLKNNHAID